MVVKIQDLIDDKKCFEIIRSKRWSTGVFCTSCASKAIICNGSHRNQPHRQQYVCKDCNQRFDDLTDTVFMGSHILLKTWIICSYLMGLNQSNSQISKELDLSPKTVQSMTEKLRKGIVKKKEVRELKGEVELDEVYIVAGHKGNPAAVASKGRDGRRNRLKGKRGRGTLAEEKAPVLGMIERKGEVIIKLLPNVQQKTIKPIITGGIESGTLLFTDEYNIYNRLSQWGFGHKMVNHSKGEYARDEDGDGFHEVHVNTMEGFWSLLRSWLRPHRGISQEKLPFYLRFFEFVHNQRKRGKHLLDCLLDTLLSPDKRTIEQFLDFSIV